MSGETERRFKIFASIVIAIIVAGIFSLSMITGITYNEYDGFTQHTPTETQTALGAFIMIIVIPLLLLLAFYMNAILSDSESRDEKISRKKKQDKIDKRLKEADEKPFVFLDSKKKKTYVVKANFRKCLSCKSKVYGYGEFCPECGKEL